MSTLNLDFYKGTDVYSDGDIEDEILNMTRDEDYIKNLRTSDNWAVLYHLTPERRNLLEWYDFNKNDEVLEIGAGCGALTEFYCEKVKSVTSIELSKRRAEVIQNRTKKFDNVEIIVGNLNDIKIDRQYDYISLIGVLEYAKSFTEGDHPYETFLQNMKKYLKPTGTLIIAIENKFGLKYWAGAREDHTRRVFDSIENYPNGAHVQTFGKSELKELLNSVGFENVEFYYPYPDYKIPEQILTDEAECAFCNDFDNDNAPNYDQSRYILFNERLAMKNLVRNKIYGEFANSFLVFANNNAKSGAKTIYSRLRRGFANKYQIETSITLENGKYTIVKKPLTEKAKEHTNEIFNNNNLLKNKFKDSQTFDVAECNYVDGKLYFEYIDGEDLHSELSKISALNDKDKMYEFLDSFISLLHQIYPDCTKMDFDTENIKEFSGTNKKLYDVECVQNPNIDLIPSNIIKKDSKYYIIDTEWIINGYVPFNFIVYRALALFMNPCKNLFLKIIPQDELLQHLNIPSEEIAIYTQMNDAFMDKIINENINYKIKQQYLKEQIDYAQIIREKEILTTRIQELQNNMNLMNHKAEICRAYYKYKIFSKILFAKPRKHYKQKAAIYHEKVRLIRKLEELYK